MLASLSMRNVTVRTSLLALLVVFASMILLGGVVGIGALKITNGNVTQAARLAKRNRTEFYKLLQRHHLNPTMFKPLAQVQRTA